MIPDAAVKVQSKIFNEPLFAHKLFWHAVKVHAIHEDDANRRERFRQLLRHHQNRKKSGATATVRPHQLEWKKSSTISCETFNALIRLVVYRRKLTLGRHRQGTFWVYLIYETREVIVVFDDQRPCYKWHRRKCEINNGPYQLLSVGDKSVVSSVDMSMFLRVIVKWGNFGCFQ